MLYLYNKNNNTSPPPSQKNTTTNHNTPQSHNSNKTEKIHKILFLFLTIKNQNDMCACYCACLCVSVCACQYVCTGVCIKMIWLGKLGGFLLNTKKKYMNNLKKNTLRERIM